MIMMNSRETLTVSRATPWLMLFSRIALFAGFQALLALLLFLAWWFGLATPQGNRQTLHDGVRMVTSQRLRAWRASAYAPHYTPLLCPQANPLWKVALVQFAMFACVCAITVSTITCTKRADSDTHGVCPECSNQTISLCGASSRS